jgi:hypothetical protein
MSSFKKFKQNIINDKIMDIFEKIKKAFTKVAYYLWIFVPLFLAFLSFKNDYHSTKCDDVIKHKKDKYNQYIYVKSADTYHQISVDSTEYANFLVDYEKSKDIIYCYEKDDTSYFIYPVCFLVSFIILRIT